ncbi:LysE/ArgO family amino acid transporter [Oleispirillum naphthae]|uniref:LysE/ArgO family amino acid transporter n=1 Tax=Oleispirillum naphthae TaxID=2838853 RepID=UPI0030823105
MFGFSAYLAGLMLGGSLIVAIGAQNAFVLGQGLRRSFPATTAAVCSLCDVLLIGGGVAGAGVAVAMHPMLARGLTLAGAAFMLVYGALAARRAILGDGQGLGGGRFSGGRRAVVGGALAVSLLNPHAYMDALLLIGGVAAQMPAASRPAFALGAMSASIVWFFGLGLGASAMAGALARPATWRVINAATAIVMAALAVRLLHGL